MADPQLQHRLAAVVRDERARVLATVIRLAGGDFELAEDAVQEALAAAIEQWPASWPTSPRAWLVATAHRRVIDTIRRRVRFKERRAELAAQAAIVEELAAGPALTDDAAVPDDRLRLIFTCCHPAIAPDAQVALTLRTLCGLTTDEIARAFLVPGPTMAQRLVRAKAKIQAARIPYQVPPAEHLAERLGAVMATIYLVFNEGYAATGGDELIRRELCTEAIRLGDVLVELIDSTGGPISAIAGEARGLLALMLLHDSRRDTRVDRDGDLVLLEDQDRARWDQAEIDRGLRLVEAALRHGSPGMPGPYAVQAAIAALHARAPRAADTDWAQIVALYRLLLARHPSPVVALNHAAAVAMAHGPAAGLALIDALGDELDDYHLMHAARADLLRRLDRTDDAIAAYRRALELAGADPERRFLARRLSELGLAIATGDGTMPAVSDVPTTASPPELTIRAIVLGVVFGALFGAANAYIGLRVGMTVATSIPVSVMTVAVLSAVGSRASILEANMAQTIGSASTALASGAIFTVPALYLWGQAPPYMQVVALTLLGGILGVSAMIPLRRLLIVRSAAELPYPEGRACAEVLHATTGGGAGARWIFLGIGLGAAAKLALGLGALVPSEVSMHVPGLLNGELALEVAPALLAVGFILGARQSAVVVSGSVVSSLCLIPLISLLLAKSAIAGAPALDAYGVWKDYVRYVGAGAVACAAVITIARGLPGMVRSLVAVIRGVRGNAEPRREGPLAAEGGGPPGRGELIDRTDRDVPRWVVVGGVTAVALAVVAIPGILGGAPLEQRLVCALAIVVLGLIFVAVASRIVGLVGVSSQPTSGICLCVLLVLGLIFGAAGWTGPGAKVAVLIAGAIVATAASKAGDISQDLKTGQLVGATPARQQLGQYLGAATACWAVAATLLFLGATYTFGSKEMAAPQATLMKTVIEGSLDGSLRWDLVLAGAGLALAAALAGVEGLAFAIGVYLPLSTMAPLFVGGLARRVVDARGKDGGHGTTGILAASGLVAGEGLAGVVVAIAVGAFGLAKSRPPILDGQLGTAGALLVIAAVWMFLVRAGRATR